MLRDAALRDIPQMIMSWVVSAFLLTIIGKIIWDWFKTPRDAQKLLQAKLEESSKIVSKLSSDFIGNRAEFKAKQEALQKDVNECMEKFHGIYESISENEKNIAILCERSTSSNVRSIDVPKVKMRDNG